MSEDWKDKVIQDFCKDKGVEILVTDEWKTLQKKIVMRKGKDTTTRFVDYESLPHFLPSPLLNSMLKELEANT